jgi:hypothetical protein
MHHGNPTAILATLRSGDRVAALEAALDAYFGPAVRPRREDIPSSLAILLSRFAPGLLRQNHLAVPSRDSRIFYIENQSCSHWALGDTSDDPRVVRDGAVVEGETLSGFAVQIVLFEASMGALGWHAAGFMNPREHAPLLSNLSEVPLRPWTWPTHASFYVAPGIVAHADVVSASEAWVFASATTQEELLELARHNGIEWTGVESTTEEHW